MTGTPRTLKQRLGAWITARLPMSRSSIALVRAELAAVRVRLAYAWLPWWRARASRWRALRDVYVNVASGPYALTGFVNVDLDATAPGVIRWDCRTSLPFADGAVRGIRMEHFAEHLEPRDEFPALLADCRRCLVPGGTLRVIVPDAAASARAYLAPGTAALAAIGVPIPFPDDLPTRMDVLAFTFHQWHEHRWGYDAESMMLRFAQAGFRDVQVTAFGQGRDAMLARDRAEHAPYSLYVEGTR